MSSTMAQLSLGIQIPTVAYIGSPPPLVFPFIAFLQAISSFALTSR